MLLILLILLLIILCSLRIFKRISFNFNGMKGRKIWTVIWCVLFLYCKNGRIILTFRFRHFPKIKIIYVLLFVLLFKNILLLKLNNCRSVLSSIFNYHIIFCASLRTFISLISLRSFSKIHIICSTLKILLNQANKKMIIK